MRFSLIAALAENGVIGTNLPGKGTMGLPWHLPVDLKRFRKYTWGKPLLLGRKTMDTFPGPLPGREHIVLTRSHSYTPPVGVHVVHSCAEARRLAEGILARMGGDEVMVIGGGEIYQLFLPEVQRLYLTLVHGTFVGDAYFPSELPAGTYWRVIHHEKCPADQRNRHGHSFYILERIHTVEDGCGETILGGKALVEVLQAFVAKMG